MVDDKKLETLWIDQRHDWKTFSKCSILSDVNFVFYFHAWKENETSNWSKQTDNLRWSFENDFKSWTKTAPRTWMIVRFEMLSVDCSILQKFVRPKIKKKNVDLCNENVSIFYLTLILNLIVRFCASALLGHL